MGKKNMEAEMIGSGLKTIKTKEELVTSIEEHIRGLKKGDGAEAQKSVKSHIAYLDFCDRFLETIRKKNFPEGLSGGWEYCFEISEEAAIVTLQLVGSSELAKRVYKRDVQAILEAYVLVRMEPRMLPVEEYALLHEVNVGTVRQWIRRGKIRSAQKLGNEWRIPEFVEPAGGKYRDGFFMWDEKLTNLPEGFEYLNDYYSAAITQVDKDSYKMALQSSSRKVKDRLVLLNAAERERLELALIADPLVSCLNGSLNFEQFEKNLEKG